MGKQAQKPATRISRSDWLTKADLWHGLAQGTDLNTNVTVLFFATEDVGAGPSWHSHPYDEVFIIRKGRARFTIGEEVIVAETGDILMGPAAVPHKYVNLGPGPLESIDIHLSPEWIQVDLKDPDA